MASQQSQQHKQRQQGQWQISHAASGPCTRGLVAEVMPEGYRPVVGAKDNARSKVQRVVFSEDLVVNDEASFSVSCLFSVVL